MARLLVLLFTFSLVITAYGLSGPNRKYGKPTSPVPTTRSNEPQGNVKQPSKPSHRGLSAWGIVALVISMILVVMGVYYFIIFYPLLCAKERKYDVIDSSSSV